MSKITCARTSVNSNVSSNRNINIDFNHSKFFKLYSNLFTQFNPNQACVLSLIYDRISLSHKNPSHYYDTSRSAFFVIFSRDEIASKLSLSVSTVGRIITYLRDLGYIDTQRIYNGGLRIFCPFYEYDSKHRPKSNHTYIASHIRPSYESVYKSDSDYSHNTGAKSALHFTGIKDMPKRSSDEIQTSNQNNHSNEESSQKSSNDRSYMKNNGLLMNPRSHIDPTVQKINNNIHASRCRLLKDPNHYYDNKHVHYVYPTNKVDQDTYTFASLVDAYRGYRQYDYHHRLMIVPDDNAIQQYMESNSNVPSYIFAKIYVQDKLDACNNATSTFNIPDSYIKNMRRKYMGSNKNVLTIIKNKQDAKRKVLQHQILDYYKPKLDRYMKQHKPNSSHDHDALRSYTNQQHYQHSDTHSQVMSQSSKLGNIENRLDYAYNMASTEHESITSCVHKVFPSLKNVSLTCKVIHGRKRTYIRLINAPRVARQYSIDRENHKSDSNLYVQDDLDNQYLTDCLSNRIKMPANLITTLTTASCGCPFVLETYIGLVYESKYHAYNAVKHELKPSNKHDLKKLHDAFNFAHNGYYDCKQGSVAQVLQNAMGKFNYTNDIRHWQSYMFTALERIFEQTGKAYLKKPLNA